jgi:hypothetical protein
MRLRRYFHHAISLCADEDVDVDVDEDEVVTTAQITQT